MCSNAKINSNNKWLLQLYLLLLQFSDNVVAIPIEPPVCVDRDKGCVDYLLAGDSCNTSEWLQQRCRASCKLCKTTKVVYDSCGSKVVSGLVNFVAASHDNGLQIFPRNGFLLGIVRHGGFLPGEPIDTDLGVIYNAKLRSTRRIIGKNGVVYDFSWEDETPSYVTHSHFAGRHPGTNQLLPYNLRVSSVEGDFEMGIFFSLNEHQLMYPFWTGPHNAKASVINEKRYVEEGGSFNGSVPGQFHYVYNKSDWTGWMRMPFYDNTIIIPSGYKGILTATYGRNWGMMEERSNYFSTRTKQGHIVRVGEVPPKDLCA